MRATKVKFLEELGDDFMREVCFGDFRHLKRIEGGMFSECTSLTHVSFVGLNQLESIGDWMFNECIELTQVSLEGLNSLKTIGEHMFAWCISIVQVSFERLNSLERGDYLKHILTLKQFKHLTY
jgi:hypothetical protein